MNKRIIIDPKITVTLFNKLLPGRSSKLFMTAGHVSELHGNPSTVHRDMGKKRNIWWFLDVSGFISQPALVPTR